MSILLDDFHKLEAEVAQLQADKNRAEGALAQLLSRLKQEFGCKTLEEAKNLLEKLQTDERRLAKEFTEAKERFEKKWKSKLGV